MKIVPFYRDEEPIVAPNGYGGRELGRVCVREAVGALSDFFIRQINDTCEVRTVARVMCFHRSRSIYELTLLPGLAMVR